MFLFLTTIVLCETLVWFLMQAANSIARVVFRKLLFVPPFWIYLILFPFIPPLFWLSQAVGRLIEVHPWLRPWLIGAISFLCCFILWLNRGWYQVSILVALWGWTIDLFIGYHAPTDQPSRHDELVSSVERPTPTGDAADRWLRSR